MAITRQLWRNSGVGHGAKAKRAGAKGIIARAIGAVASSEEYRGNIINEIISVGSKTREKKMLAAVCA